MIIVMFRHSQTDFSKIQHYVGQMAMKNVELTQVINGSLDNGSSFFLWIYSVLTRVNGPDNFEIPEDVNGQSGTDNNKILKFIKSYIDPKRISQYFEPTNLEYPFQKEESETSFQNLIRKYEIDNQYIYDNSYLEDSKSISNLSLKKILDYTRRLITVREFKSKLSIYYNLEIMFPR